jgi:hypothetical protein
MFYNKNQNIETKGDVENNNNKLTTIAISRENYFKLKNLGQTGDSFNDVLTMILKSDPNMHSSIHLKA